MERQTIGYVLAREQTALTADEKLASLFQPDTLLSAQYFANHRRKTALEPEKKLMLAVLDDAIRCLLDNRSARSPDKKKLYDQAAQWITEEGGDWIFSFDNVCEALGFSPDYVRGGLLPREPRAHGQQRIPRWEGRKLAG